MRWEFVKVKDSDERLHNLLQVKRLERPNDERWLKFDRCFEEKRLSAVVNGRSSFLSWFFAVFADRRFACIVSGLCLSAIIAIGVSRGGKCCLHSDSLSSLSDVRLSYVRDDMVCNIENMDLKTAFNHVPRGVWYVCDSMSSRGVFAK
jgi:hypothetical protein